MLKRDNLIERARAILPPLLIVLAVGIAYSNSLSGPFVLDDLPSIADNPSIRHLGTALSTPVESSTHGRPILNLSFALDYAVHGYSVEGYHLVNVVIHAASALLLFGIVRRTVARSLGQSAIFVAFGTSLLWAIHPLNTEAVTYITQRAESLMGFFLLLTLYSFIRSSTDSSYRSKVFGGVCIASCLFGMATKEVMVVAPLVIWLYDRSFLSSGFAAALRSRPKLYSGLAATWVVLIVLVASTHGRGGTAGFDTGVSSWSYLLTQTQAICHYLRLTIYPAPLVFYYGLGLVTSPVAVLPQAVFLIALLIASVWALIKHPGIGFLGAIFFLALAPSSSFVPVATETVAEHRMYLALIPVILLVVLGICRWLGQNGYWIVLPLALVLIAVTFERNQSYRSALRLWRDTVAADSTNPWAHNNLGCELDLIPGQSRDAVAQFETAIALKPDHAEAHYNLANDLRLMPGRLDDAVTHYETAIKYAPRFAKAQNNLAALLAEDPKRIDEAIAHYREAIRLNPDYAEAHLNLGNAWSRVEGRQRDAISEYQTAIQLRPNYAEAYNNLAKVYSGNAATQADAVEQLTKAIAINPRYSEAQYNLGTVLSTMPGRVNDAIDHLREAIRLKPDYGDAQNNLANLLASMPEHWDEAVALYRQALANHPDSAEEHYNLAATLLKSPGHEEEAKIQLREFLKIEPENATARQVLESLEH